MIKILESQIVEVFLLYYCLSFSDYHFVTFKRFRYYMQDILMRPIEICIWWWWWWGSYFNMLFMLKTL